MQLIVKSEVFHCARALVGVLPGRRRVRSGLGRMAAACALSGVLLAVAPATAQTAGTTEKEPPAAVKGEGGARALFAQGNELYRAERFQEAEAVYRKAWALQQTYDIAANLGHTKFRLGKEAEAAGYLRFALRNWPLVGKETPRALASERLDDLRKKLGLLQMRANVSDVEITVDGAPLGDSPVAPEVFVRPGEHKVRASRAGYRPVEAAISVKKGEAREVPLELSPIERKPAPPVVATREGASAWPFVVGGGVAAVAIGAGIGLTVAAQAKYAEADRILDSFGEERRSYCGESENKSPTDCANLPSLYSAGNKLQNLGTAGFVGGGAVLAGTVLYYVLSPSRKEDQRAATRVAPLITTSHGGFQVSGDF